MKPTALILCCPKCHGMLNFSTKNCKICTLSYLGNQSQFIFNSTWKDSSLANEDWLNKIKEQAKLKLGGIYQTLIALLSPVYIGKLPLDFLGLKSGNKIILNLGSGTSNFGSDVINVDLADYKNVDIVCSLDQLPVQSDSVDGIINIAVLEHVSNPQKVVQEFHRVLRSKGRLLCFVPFIQGIHASPYDFQRYTDEGLRVLFKDFRIVSIDGKGPTSGLIWILQEWLALTLSFGSKSIYKALIPALWILSPLKYFDFFLNHHPCRKVIASGMIVTAIKE